MRELDTSHPLPKSLGVCPPPQSLRGDNLRKLIPSLSLLSFFLFTQSFPYLFFMLFQVGLNPLLLCLKSRGSIVYFIKQHKKDNYRKSQLQLNRRTALWDRLTFLRLISSFFCSTNLAGIPPMLSWALQRCSHNSPRKMRAFLGLRKPVRLICISFGSGNCKDRGRQHVNVGHTDRQGISTYQHLPCPAESSHNKTYTL